MSWQPIDGYRYGPFDASGFSRRLGLRFASHLFPSPRPRAFPGGFVQISAPSGLDFRMTVHQTSLLLSLSTTGPENDLTARAQEASGAPSTGAARGAGSRSDLR